jgi:hypothetical protein
VERILDTMERAWSWLVHLPPDFAFLLSVPFLVALTGLLAELGKSAPRPAGSAPAKGSEPPARGENRGLG